MSNKSAVSQEIAWRICNFRRYVIICVCRNINIIVLEFQCLALIKKKVYGEPVDIIIN